MSEQKRTSTELQNNLKGYRLNSLHLLNPALSDAGLIEEMGWAQKWDGKWQHSRNTQAEIGTHKHSSTNSRNRQAEIAL